MTQSQIVKIISVSLSLSLNYRINRSAHFSQHCSFFTHTLSTKPSPCNIFEQIT